MKKEIIKTEIKVEDNIVGVIRYGNIDYISFTDLARLKNEKNSANLQGNKGIKKIEKLDNKKIGD